MALCLEHLPYEIIQRIASSCCASAALALAQSCRQLRGACWDPLVFRHIILAGDAAWCANQQVQSYLERTLASETASWAKLALADQRATELRGGLDGDFRGHYFEQALQWAPQLITFQHPFTSSSWLALKLSEVVHGLRLDIRGVFCYTAAMLGTNDDGHEMVATSEEAMRQMPDDVMKSRTRWKAFRALGAFAVLLRQAIKDGKVFNQPVRHGDVVLVSTGGNTADGTMSLMAIERQHYNEADIAGSIERQEAADSADALTVVRPPPAQDIPMLPLNHSYDMPLPFRRLSQRQIVCGDRSNWEAWNDAHVAAMCMPAYLKNSTWVGYFLDQRDPSISDGRSGFSPLADVVIKRAFEAIPSPLSPAAYGIRRPKLEIKGEGRDRHGRFELRGTMESNGQLMLRQDYIGGLDHYYWQCSVTPFGWFGTWGTRDGFHTNVIAAGAVWLWRAEWSPHIA